MKPRIAPKPKNMLPDIKKNSLVSPMKLSKPSPKLNSSRLSRQSCSIETTLSVQSEPQRKSSQNKKSNVDQIVKNKSYYNHRALMNDYLKRTNMTIQTKVFTFNSQDDYIKRCLQSHGWVENHLSSTMYDLKWVYTDNADDFVTQLDGQFYNHFKGTRELTTKQCLLVNFKNQSEYGHDTSDFFPRAFDLGNASDREDFLKEYERTCVEIILKRIVKYLKQRRKQYCKELKQAIIINYEKKKEEKLIKKMELKKTIRRKFKTIYTAEQLQSENNEKDLKFDLQIISEVFSRLSDYKRQIEYGYYDDKNFELSTQYIIRIRQNYSQLWKFDEGHSPSQFMIHKLLKYHYFFKKHDSAYKSDGVRNIWIVKPGGCARGQGIYLEKNISEAINSGMQMQARLIQKYIERPLLYKKQKFDLRQWVLVRSFQPLKVYVFSHCYMRMCSQNYDLNDTKNLLRHLTNFSLNKQNFVNQTQSIYSSDHLQEWLKTLKVDWQNTLRPQINEIIIKTLKIVQDQFEGESKYCFELFGFDIMLDEDYKPWLLEVNLSPACAERVDWLSSMLDQMAESMFNIIFGDEFKMPTQYKYELIFDEELQGNQINNYNNNNCNQEFQWEIVGQKCNIRREKQIDKRYIEYMATLMIQKFYRMYQGKKQLHFLRNTKYAIVIQKYGRRYLAIKQRYYLKRRHCATKIQTIVRMYLAIKLKQYLKKQLNATKIQCLFRRYSAIKKKHYLEQEYCALLLQSLINIKQAKQKQNKLKDNLQKYKLIQKNWRIVYQKRWHSSMRIQKIIRGVLQRNRYKILKLKNKSSIVIQKYYKGYKAKQLRQYLKKEYLALILQGLMRMKICKRKLKLNRVSDGLLKIDKVYGKFNGRRTLVQIYNQGILRNKAIMRIQSYRMVIKCKRYLKRLKRLKKLINLQAYIKMHIQRKRYRRILRRRRALKKIVKAMRQYLFRRKIMNRILRRKVKQQQYELPIQQKQRVIRKK